MTDIKLMKKHVMSVVLAGIIACGILSGCGDGKGQAEAPSIDAPQENEQEEPAAAEATVDSKAQETTEQETPVTEEPSESEEEIPTAQPASVEDEQDEEPDLKTMLLNETGAGEDEIVSFCQEDFDDDGSQEAFALIGKSTDDYGDMQLIEGDVWFAGKAGCKKIHDTAGMGFSDTIRFMTMGDTKYILIDEVYVTSMLTDVWYVSAGDVNEAAFSKRGEVITDLDGENRFRIVDSSYDSMYDPDMESFIGHTWKSYYFFYNSEDAKVYEYGGTEIDEETAEYWCKRDIVKELLPAGDQLINLFCRGNSLVVMNYEHVDDGFKNFYHYIYDFDSGHLVDDTRNVSGEEPLEGICLEALCPDMANYPQVPGPDDRLFTHD